MLCVLNEAGNIDNDDDEDMVDDNTADDADYSASLYGSSSSENSDGESDSGSSFEADDEEEFEGREMRRSSLYRNKVMHLDGDYFSEWRKHNTCSEIQYPNMMPLKEKMVALREAERSDFVALPSVLPRIHVQYHCSSASRKLIQLNCEGEGFVEANSINEGNDADGGGGYGGGGNGGDDRNGTDEGGGGGGDMGSDMNQKDDDKSDNTAPNADVNVHRSCEESGLDISKDGDSHVTNNNNDSGVGSGMDIGNVDEETNNLNSANSNNTNNNNNDSNSSKTSNDNNNENNNENNSNNNDIDTDIKTEKLINPLPGSTSMTFYAGGPVYGMDWCPLPAEEECQYIAITTHRSFGETHCISDVTALHGCIQIWCVGKLSARWSQSSSER